MNCSITWLPCYYGNEHTHTQKTSLHDNDHIILYIQRSPQRFWLIITIKKRIRGIASEYNYTTPNVQTVKITKNIMSIFFNYICIPYNHIIVKTVTKKYKDALLFEM